MAAERRVLITGAGGQLGTAFRHSLPDAHAADRSALDITDRDSVVDVVRSTRPAVIVNCAAWTAVDAAEEHERQAHSVNADAVATLAEVAAEQGARFVTFSTDYVFDGTASTPYVESSATSAVNAYGRSKLAGEGMTLDANPDSLVVRTSWLLSGTHDNFVSTMLRLAARGQSLSVVDDQVGSPTVCADVAEMVLSLIDVDASGIIHGTNSGSTTWFGLAGHAVDAAGLDVDLLSPCTTEEYPTPARRPAYSVLVSERLESLGLAAPRHWRDAVAAIVPDQVARLDL